MQALKREIKKIGSLALFFFIGFIYILVVMKLFLKEYSIDTYVFSKAVIGALFAAKAVAILDYTPWLNRFRQAPRYIDVLYKTLVYTLAVVLLGILEKLIHAFRHHEALAGAIAKSLQPSELYRFLAVILCIAVVFLFHNVFTEIDSYFGKGKLSQFFFAHRQS
jgi:hypothetical protein